MNNFLQRTISKEDGGVKVSRTRTSAGSDSILIEVSDGGTKMSATMTANATAQAKKLAALLTEIADHACELPEE